MAEDVAADVWNVAVTPDSYASPGDRYQAAILDQYKTYVEMADRIASRRALTNTFFLTLNTFALTALGLLWREQLTGARWWLSLPLAVLLVQCAAWFWLMRSYRQLSTAKWQVVGALEERLPASPFWKAEWQAVGHGRDLRLYWPLSHLEQSIPVTFAILYLAGFVAVNAS